MVHEKCWHHRWKPQKNSCINKMKSMRYIKNLILSLMIISTLPMTALAASDPGVAFSQALTSFQTYVATFNQLTYDSHGRVIQQGQGRVMIRRPGFFRWETNTPTHQIIITDGKILWIYDVDLTQATQQALSQKVTVNPATLLSGSVENLKQQFTISLKPGGQREEFLLQPKQKDMSFKWMTLRFQHNQLENMTVLNNLDETSEYQFKQIRINRPLSPHLFQFIAPPGVDVVNQKD